MAIRNNVVAKEATELVVIFHKKTTKLVYLWPNIGQLINTNKLINTRRKYVNPGKTIHIILAVNTFKYCVFFFFKFNNNYLIFEDLF